MNRLIAAAACLAMLTGCATVPAAQCDGWKPLRPKVDTVDYLAQHDPVLIDQLITNNRNGEKYCGWKR